MGTWDTVVFRKKPKWSWQKKKKFIMKWSVQLSQAKHQTSCKQKTMNPVQTLQLVKAKPRTLRSKPWKTTIPDWYCNVSEILFLLLSSISENFLFCNADDKPWQWQQNRNIKKIMLQIALITDARGNTLRLTYFSYSWELKRSIYFNSLESKTRVLRQAMPWIWKKKIYLD